jgi:hypothetical protein
MEFRRRTAGQLNTSDNFLAKKIERFQAGRGRPATSIMAGARFATGAVKGSLASLASVAALDCPFLTDQRRFSGE